MTLIIGAKCDEGIVLVGDTKVVDVERNIITHEPKILLPLPLPVAVGASGFTNLFRQFNRRIPIIVEQRDREYKIKNEEALNKIGLGLKDFEMPKQEPELIQSSEDLKEPPRIEKAKKDVIKIPYIYTGEHFLQDCKLLIKEIGEEGKEYHPNPLEVLLSFTVGTPVLFHINCDGLESEINSYVAIGSGTPYVDMFFSRLWKKRTLMDTIALASFVIKFIENIKLDNYVGVAEEEMPQVIVLLKNGRYGPLDFSNKPDFLKDIVIKIENIEKTVKNINFISLELGKEYKIE